RPRPCQPDEILRACLRDVQAEADARGVRLAVESREPGASAWADPDALRHLAEALIRNALEATPVGGALRATAAGGPRQLDWTIRDGGPGLGPTEARHLFD